MVVSTTDSPISLLPPEILRNVFVESVGDHIDHPVQYHPNAAPLVLTRVCRTWRQAAISDAALWSLINIVLSDPQRTSTNYCFPPPDELGRILERSQSHPLSLQLNFKFFRFVEEVTSAPLIEQTMRLIQSNMFRVKHLELSGPQSPVYHAPTSPWDLDTTALEGLTIHNLRAFARDISPTTLPRIRELTLLLDQTLRPSIPLPFDTLTYLNLGIMRLLRSTYDVMLKELPNLRKLIIAFVEQDPLHATCEHDSISLPNLRSLAVFGSMPGIACFLHRLEIPQLEELVIRGAGQDSLPGGGGPLDVEFPSLFSRNLFPLRELVLIYTTVPICELVSCLRLVSSSLISLQIRGYPNFYDEITSAFNPNDVSNASPLCPRLEQLDLHHCLKARKGAFAEMLQSRCEILNNRLRLSVLIDPCHSNTYAVDLHRLVQLRDQGLLEVDWREKEVTLSDFM